VTDTVASQSAGASPSKGVLARALGIVFSPRSTYADVARQPHAFLALVLVIVISAVATVTFLSTAVGRRAALDQQLSSMESFGFHPTAEQIQQIERRASSGPYFVVAAQIVFIRLISLIVAGIGLAVFTAALGGSASFKQGYAVVVHSWFIPMLMTPFVMPLNYLRESLSSPTTLAIFLPWLDETSFFGRWLSSIDLIRIWWLVSLSIGFGVLYKRRTAPIAGGILALYVALALIAAAVMASISGV